MRLRFAAGSVVMACGLGMLNGCTTPDAANIQLRKQVQSLQDQNQRLQIQHVADQASLKEMQSGTTLPTTFPASDFGLLFTAHGIRLGRLTGGVDLDPAKPGDEALRVSVIPFDEDHDDFKAAGSISVDAFDLDEPNTRIGHWTFSAAQTRDLWNGHGLMYEYVVTCPWQSKPQHSELTVKVTFVDALTGRAFSEQKVVKISLPNA
ncbi:MAG: hypothetical protein ACTHM6_05370 [Tepidisphaeraceae bacterium]